MPIIYRVQATEDVQQGLTQDDFDMYYEVGFIYNDQMFSQAFIYVIVI